jgi:hypothetical protein
MTWDYDSDAQYENERMSENVAELAEAVVGHRIVQVDYTQGNYFTPLEITLDNGKKVLLANTSDCCAYTELNRFLLNPDKIDHIITGVTAGENFETWHIYADMEDVLSLDVSWSSGNTGYYGFGFDIAVVDA